MTSQPTLQTARLTLRPFTLADAADVQRLAGEREIADTTLNIPHPYEDGMAEQWISTHQDRYAKGELATFALELRDVTTLIGTVSLQIHEQHANAELGYWIGTPFWSRGYCTEAAHAVVGYGFEALHLHRVYAYHMKRNPASGRVLQKIGMGYEGCLRQHVKKWEQFEDLEAYGILREEWATQTSFP